METETSEDYDIDLLRAIKKRSAGRISSERLKYLHLKSIDNFLYHFHDLVLSEKQNVYSRIFTYLTLIDDEDIHDIDGWRSKLLFEDYVYPIPRIYHEHLGFVVYARAWIFIVWGGIIGFILMSFQAPFYLYVILSAAFALMYVRILVQAKRKKVYGYFY